MTEFLLRHFVKNADRTEDTGVRTAYGELAGMVGIFLNLLLFLAKLLIGILSGAVSVMADAFNNLSDAASSIISFVGARMADKPADEEHPFGHGRIEYIAAFIVAFLVLQVGFMLLKSSFQKLLHPEELSISAASFLVLLISVLAKLWLSVFNRKLGMRIQSKIMLATAADARSDVFATSATILSLLVFALTGTNIDGLIGLCVSVLVLKAGIDIAKDTLEPIIGERMDPVLSDRIARFVRSYPGVLGVHDLIIHNYGPSHYIASIHVELDSSMSLDEAHLLLDRIEVEAKRKLDLLLVTHTDPIDMQNTETLALRKLVAEAVEKEGGKAVSCHDVRLIKGSHGTNAVFDLVVPWNYSEEKIHTLIEGIKAQVKGHDKRIRCIITVEHGYGA
ncbi:MAG: cation diffusion facilitator family transporter [Eubacteriales bacterium]|nr:cation diffusion facilitator family transporter [Eubacteriales bacterium]